MHFIWKINFDKTILDHWFSFLVLGFRAGLKCMAPESRNLHIFTPMFYDHCLNGGRCSGIK